MKIYSCLFLLLILSCSCTPSYQDIKTIINTNIHFPYQQLIKNKYSYNCDSKSQILYILKIIDEKNCIRCYANKMAYLEDFCSDKYHGDIGLKYVINCNSNDKERIEKELYDQHIKSIFYIDTCQAFRNANPQIMNNEICQTMVINKKGKIVMVGDPFQNKSMEVLFGKIINLEKKYI